MAAGDYTGYADYLASLLPGLCVQVARAWLAAEGGGPGANNPLNVTRTGSGLDASYTSGPGLTFANYPSVEVGLQAAAWLVKHGLYAGIRVAIPTHNPALQRLAIISSPWAGGHYNHGASFPIVTGPCQAPSGATTGIPAGSGSAGVTEASYTPGQVVQPNLAGFLGISESAAFTDTLAQQAAAKYARTNAGVGPAYQYAYNSIYSALKVWETAGTTAGMVPFNVDAQGHNTGSVVVPSPSQLAAGNTTRGSIDLNPLDALSAALGGLLSALGPLLINGLVLVGVLYLGVQGVRQTTSGDQDQTTGGLFMLAIAGGIGALWYHGYFADWIATAISDASATPPAKRPLGVPGQVPTGGGSNRLTVAAPPPPPPSGQSA